ncbi:MAG: tRNA pseudouridine(13) synthase TruD [Bacteroidales bacterium]|nr:tRNA pseudouridine(13) synthase TruD [Bacteroidales bacterium]
MQYKLKHLNRDFQVREVFYEPKWCNKNDGYFTILELRKENINTFDAIQHLANKLNVNADCITYSGLKDEDAITTQIVAINNICDENEVEVANTSNIEFKIRGYTQDGLQIGGLHGNAFNITLRDIKQEDSYLLSNSIGKTLKTISINYYDNQRFGIPNHIKNTHIIGQYILENQWENAFNEYLKSGNPQQEKELMINRSKIVSYKDAFFDVLDSRKLSFLINSYMSKKWNDELSAIISRAEVNSTMHDNEVMSLCFLKNGSQINIDNNYLKYDYYSVSKDGSFEKNEKQRQKILFNEVRIGKFEEDDIFNGKLKLDIFFYMPSGCYATMLIKQMFLEL